MNRKNTKLSRLVVVLIVAGLGAGGLLRANDERAEKGAKEPAAQKSQEQVLQDLLDEKSPGPMIMTNKISDEVIVAPVEAVDPKPKRPLTVRERDQVINRMGRLGKDAKGSPLFVYESDATALNEPPLILLPCMMLEQMELVAAKKPNVKFTVTGEVTVYHGKGYLLLRKVILYRDLGQF